MNKTIQCPVCGQTESIEKVSTLYLKGLGLRDKVENASDPQARQARPKPTPALRELSRRLAPPSGGRAGFTRPVNPDYAILALSAILPIFVYGIWASQRILFLPVLGVLVIFYGLFFWQRGRMVARFQQGLASRQGEESRVKRGIERWLKLYYCAADEVVFEPGTGDPVSIDLLPGFLMQQE